MLTAKQNADLATAKRPTPEFIASLRAKTELTPVERSCLDADDERARVALSGNESPVENLPPN